MKAQNYQIRGDNLVLYVLLLGLLIPLGSACMDSSNLGELTGGILMAQLGSIMPLIYGMACLVLISRICGWDAVDKTMNYEIMAGHSRAEVYFGRVLVSVLWGLGAGIIMLLFPLLVVSIINGWGNNMALGDVALRCILALFPMLRLICEVAMLTFLLKSFYQALVIGYVFCDIVMVGGMIYEEMTDASLTVQTALYNLTWVLDFSNAKYEYIDGKDIPVFLTAVSPSMAAGTILVSLLVGGICLALGYRIFRKADLH
ncbi:MAG: hypothetical protein NC300_01355 [Bacteroidales bacterium]|nr:hypothetical protein [Clostridium sp.]MCM1202772.1 hypothetical protein [Bacteroidales bacterium]